MSVCSLFRRSSDRSPRLPLFGPWEFAYTGTRSSIPDGLGADARRKRAREIGVVAARRREKSEAFNAITGSLFVVMRRHARNLCPGERGSNRCENNGALKGAI